MLGPLGPFISNHLRNKGFVIDRPSWIERKFARGLWKNWLATNPELFASVYSTNRATLAGVKNWISDETLSHSLWRYGVLEEWSASHSEIIDRTGLNDIEDEITASDMLGFAARRLSTGVSYLEIGVSVGKNLLQIERQLTDAAIVGLDVEAINPVLRDRFTERTTTELIGPVYEVDTLSGLRAQKQTSVQYLASDRNTFDYLSADQFRRGTWNVLNGRTFNLIFSDGVHTPQALRAEMEFLLMHDLIDKSRLVMFWDDLVEIEMQTAFLDNARILCTMFGKKDFEAVSIFQLHGSYGMKRLMGMFSSL